MAETERLEDTKELERQSPGSTRRTSAVRPVSQGRVLLVAVGLSADDPQIAHVRSELEGRGFFCPFALTLDPARAREAAAVVIVAGPAPARVLDALARGREQAPNVPFFVTGDDDGALDACCIAGAYCLRTPFDATTFCELLDEREPSSHGPVRAVPTRRGAWRITAHSAPMQRVVSAIEHVARSRSTALISGESGTGKELVAEAIHELSPRAERPFIRLHCAALADSLLETELFGHERGAFTGAVSRREGHFERADGGTLFLDEIGEIGPTTQIKLLRVLQHRTFERVGGGQTIKVDVRIIAATNRDLAAEVRAGRFRQDLYYRLNVINIEVPPLRTRTEDIVPLATVFLQRFTVDNGKDVRGFTPAAIRRLQNHPWPGNVRELENAIERAVVLADGTLIDEAQLPELPGEQRQSFVHVPGMTLDEIERWAILSAFEASGGSTAGAARMLGISVRKVQYRLQSYGKLTPRMMAIRGVERIGAGLTDDAGVAEPAEREESDA